MSVNKVIIWSSIVCILGYLTYQELAVITDRFLVQIVIPAKRSDVFRALANPELTPVFHPLCIGVHNITKSKDEKGIDIVQYIYSEKVPTLGFSHRWTDITLSFPVNRTVIPNSEIHNDASVMSGVLIIRQTWKLSDSGKTGNGINYETLVETHFEFTTRRFLARFVKNIGLDAYTKFLDNLKLYVVAVGEKK